MDSSQAATNVMFGKNGGSGFQAAGFPVVRQGKPYSCAAVYVLSEAWDREMSTPMAALGRATKVHDEHADVQSFAAGPPRLDMTQIQLIILPNFNFWTCK